MLSLTQECPTFFGQEPHSWLCTVSRNQSVKFTRGGTPTGLNYSAIFMLRTYIRIQLFTNVASGRIKQTLRPRIWNPWTKEMWPLFFRHVSITAKSNWQLRHVCLSVRPSFRIEHLCSHWRDFHDIWCLSIFRKYVEKIQVSLKYDENNGYFIRRPISIFDHVSISTFRRRNFSDKICRNKQNTYFTLKNIFFFRKSCRLWDNVEKYCRARQAADDNVAHAHWMLDTLGYKHTLRICNIHCFSTVTTVARTRLNVTFNINCLSCVPSHKGANFHLVGNRWSRVFHRWDLKCMYSVIHTYCMTKILWSFGV